MVDPIAVTVEVLNTMKRSPKALNGITFCSAKNIHLEGLEGICAIATCVLAEIYHGRPDLVPVI
jgi:hypothetical protein